MRSIDWSSDVCSSDLVVGAVAERAYPHGPYIPAGDYECANDGRGPCAEVYYEDLDAVRGVVPDWVIFARDNNFAGFGYFGTYITLVFVYITTPLDRKSTSLNSSH